MKNFIVWTRGYTVDLAEALSYKLTSLGKNCEIWTMEIKAYNWLISKDVKCIYCPDKINAFKAPDHQYLNALEFQLRTSFNIGLAEIYEMERYTERLGLSGLNHQAMWLYNSIQNNTTIVSFTMDHAVFILAGFIARIKNGSSRYLQPVGFPANSAVFLSSPGEFVNCNNRGDTRALELLESYTASINCRPEEVLNYMAKNRIPNVLYRLMNKYALIKNLVELRKNKFSYLNIKSDGKVLIPDTILGIGRHREKGCLDLSELKRLKSHQNRIFYFPLHLEPEMTLMVYSNLFRSQSELIRIVSSQLSLGDVLIVKENPKTFLRYKNFYNDIGRLKNVVWASRNINSRDIIGCVDKVISISGTASIEAAIMGKNSLFLGKPPFYNVLVQKPLIDLPLTKWRDAIYRFHTKEDIYLRLKTEGLIFIEKTIQFSMVPHLNGNNRQLDFNDKDLNNLLDNILK